MSPRYCDKGLVEVIAAAGLSCTTAECELTLRRISERRRKVVEMRHGLTGSAKATTRVLGAALGCSNGRALEIYKRALAEISVEEKRRRLGLEPGVLPEKVEDWDLSVRAANCFQNAGIVTLTDLLSRDRSSLLETKNFGKKSLREIEAILASAGLELTRLGDEARQRSTLWALARRFWTYSVNGDGLVVFVTGERGRNEV